MQRRIMHFDMDAFFASVEALDDPSLRGKAVIVGGLSPRGVVSAASYEARKYGVRSAMPMRRARELCPHAVYLRPRMSRYKEISEGIFDLLRTRASLVEKMSVDEGYLDISDVTRTDAAALLMGRRIKDEIRDRFGLIASIGIAPCKFIAKIASDLRKPDSLVQVRSEEVDDFLAPLEVGRIPGVGRVGERKLHALGVYTIGQLREQNRLTLQHRFGKWGLKLYDYARGIDRRKVETTHVRKSLGKEETFDEDLLDTDALGRRLLKQSERIAAILEDRGWSARTVTLKVRYSDFSLITRRRTFEQPMRNAGDIAAIAGDLMLSRTEAGRRPVRLVGVTVSGLVEERAGDSGELPLFG